MYMVKVVLKNRAEYIKFTSCWAANLAMRRYVTCADVVRCDLYSNGSLISTLAPKVCGASFFELAGRGRARPGFSRFVQFG